MVLLLLAEGGLAGLGELGGVVAVVSLFLGFLLKVGSKAIEALNGNTQAVTSLRDTIATESQAHKEALESITTETCAQTVILHKVATGQDELPERLSGVFDSRFDDIQYAVQRLEEKLKGPDEKEEEGPPAPQA